MPCTEAYKEHIEYTFNAFCRVVIYYALSTHGVTGIGGDKEKYLLNMAVMALFVWVSHYFSKGLRYIIQKRKTI